MLIHKYAFLTEIIFFNKLANVFNLQLLLYKNYLNLSLIALLALHKYG